MHFKIKTIRGHKYLYLIQNAWVNGRSKQVKQICVGSPDKVHELLTGKESIKVTSFSFGKIAALLHAANSLGLIEAIDDHVDKKHIPGLSVGEYIFILISGRADGVLSRRGIKKWFNNSMLQFIFKPE